MAIESFKPPMRTLMGPGPSDVSPRVLAALSRPTIGHLDPQFIRMMDECKVLLQYAFQTKNDLTFPISAPGSAGMEMSFVNVVESGDTVIVCQNGVFGSRMKDIVTRLGATAVVVEDEWGETVSYSKVVQAFAQHPSVKALACVHAETSTGVRSDVAALAQLAHQHGALMIVDAVTSLAGIPLLVDEWQLDIVYSGTQKCLSAPPGISPITFSKRAIDVINARSTKIVSWFLDINLIMGYWGQGARAYHHTAPTNALYALHEALLMLQEEGLKASHARHLHFHLSLCAGLEAMGLSLLVNKQYRLPQLNTVIVPQGIDEAQVRQDLLRCFNIEIGAGLGSLAGNVWRIGLMGSACNPKNLLFLLHSLECVLSKQGYVAPACGVRAAARILSTNALPE